MALVTIKVPQEAVDAAKNSKQFTEAVKAASVAACKAFLEVMQKPSSMFASNDTDSGEQVA